MPQKKKATPSSNPFTEIQNKRRSAILGKKVKGQQRNVLKARQDQARERTTKLLDELRTQKRTTTFKDARFGDNVDYDETMLRRFQKERKKQAKRSFALDDSATLTHGGVAIGDVPDEELKAAAWDDELDAAAEREAMTLFQSENFSGSGGAKSRDEIYKEIIAKSKRRKVELYREKEDQERKLNSFNADFQDLMKELQFKPKKTIEVAEQSAEDKQYDIMTKTFAFERKAEASDRLKTKEELLEEKATRLAKLEEEREARMKGIEKKASKADDYDDGEEKKEESDEDEEEEQDKGDEEEIREAEAEGEEDAEEVAEIAEGEEAEEIAEGEKVADAEEAADSSEESVDLDVEIENTSVPQLTTISLPEKSYPSFCRPPEIDCMVNLENEGHLPFTLEAPTSVEAYVALEKYGLEHLAKVILRAQVIARRKAAAMVRPFLDYLVEALKSRGFATIYALEPVILEFLANFSKDIFAYFTEKVDAIGDVEQPTMEHIALVKIAAHVFPTTDLWHPITTSVMMLLERWALSMKVEVGCRSRALLLFGLLYEYTAPSRRYSPAMFVLGQQLNCPLVASVLAEFGNSFDVCPMGREVKSLAPLLLHYRPPAQVAMLDPVFHDPSDGPIQKGDPSRSEDLRLRRKYNDERRAAARNLRRDQQYLQVIKTKENEKVLRAEQNERKRVRRLMDEEDHEVKKIMMQHSGMDTSLNPYSQNKKRKKENRRMGGNKTKGGQEKV